MNRVCRESVMGRGQLGSSSGSQGETWGAPREPNLEGDVDDVQSGTRAPAAGGGWRWVPGAQGDVWGVPFSAGTWALGREGTPRRSRG